MLFHNIYTYGNEFLIKFSVTSFLMLLFFRASFLSSILILFVAGCCKLTLEIRMETYFSFPDLKIFCFLEVCNMDSIHSRKEVLYTHFLLRTVVERTMNCVTYAFRRNLRPVHLKLTSGIYIKPVNKNESIIRFPNRTKLTHQQLTNNDLFLTYSNPYKRMHTHHRPT